MKPAEKPDAERIVARLEALKQESWLRGAQSWWPDFLFHVTDAQNAANILKSGHLLSRARCEQTGVMAFDNASGQVLAGTDPAWKEFVRLYFRPMTPFQYRTEGFRPSGQRSSLDAYCPMPVVFLFDAAPVLTRADTLFSDGNLAAANPQVGNDATFFDKLPFREIYHSSGLSDVEKRSIVYHRHAEVMIPGQLGLSAVRRIWCRSPAEQETLRSLVPEERWRGFWARVGSSSRPNLFNCKWTFVEQARLSADEIDIRLNPGTVTPGPFAAQIELLDDQRGLLGSWSDDAFDSRAYEHSLVFDPNFLGRSAGYRVRFWLDERLAYEGSYSGEAEDLLF